MEVRKASIIIQYTPKAKRSITQKEMELFITRKLEDIPDIHHWFVDENGLRAISLVVVGTDSVTVANVANELASQMRQSPAVTALVANVIADTSLDRPELRILPRMDLSVRLGISTESLAESIRVATIGDVEPALAKFDTGERLPVHEDAGTAFGHAPSAARTLRVHKRLCRAIARVTSTGTWASASARNARAARAAGRSRQRLSQSPTRGIADRSMSMARLMTAATLRSATVNSGPSR